MEHWDGGPDKRLSIVRCVAVKPGWGAGGLSLFGAEPVGASGRAPGCGGGGREASAVVVAGTEAGVVRVGGGC